MFQYYDHIIPCGFETKAKPGENVAAATMALLKSTFPAIWVVN
jgi:hypothetical protein